MKPEAELVQMLRVIMGGNPMPSSHVVSAYVRIWRGAGANDETIIRAVTNATERYKRTRGCGWE
jgi:hypothetical protein